MPGTIPKVIFVISSARSGSTLLGKYLDSHPKTLLVNEIFGHAVFQKHVAKNSPKSGATTQSLIESLERYKLNYGQGVLHRIKLVKFLLMAFIKIVNQLSLRLWGERWNFWRRVWFVNSLHEPFWQPFWSVIFTKKEPDIWIFKEILPRNALVWIEINPLGTHKIIHLIRSPYTRTASELRNDSRKSIYQDLVFYREQGFKVDINYHTKSMAYQTAYAWANQNDYVLKIAKRKYDYMSLRYEDLVNKPQETLRKVFNFSGLFWEASTQKFYEKMNAHSAKQKHARSVFKKKSVADLHSSELSAQQNKEISKAVTGSAALAHFYPQL